MNDRRGIARASLTTAAILAVLLALGAVRAVAGNGLNFKQTLRFAAEMARGGSWREARFRWEQAAREQPDDPRVLNNLAVAAEALGEFDEARKRYDRALAVDPANLHIQENQRRFARFWRQLEQRRREHGEATDDEAPAPTAAVEAEGKKKGKVERVTVGLPVPPRLKLQGDEKVLVASFLADDTHLLDINRELVRFLRTEFRKRTALEILDVVPPPAVPEQRVADLLANTEFWKHLHREFGADLIVSGALTYDRQDVSGFEDIDIVSPSSGQKVRRTQFVEREQFSYELDIFFIDGPTGTLRHRERLQRGAVFKGLSNDPITAFYELSESIAQDVLAVVTSRSRKDTRVIFKG